MLEQKKEGSKAFWFRLFFLLNLQKTDEEESKLCRLVLRLSCASTSDTLEYPPGQSAVTKDSHVTWYGQTKIQNGPNTVK